MFGFNVPLVKPAFGIYQDLVSRPIVTNHCSGDNKRSASVPIQGQYLNFSSNKDILSNVKINIKLWSINIKTILSDNNNKAGLSSIGKPVNLAPSIFTLSPWPWVSIFYVMRLLYHYHQLFIEMERDNTSCIYWACFIHRVAYYH